MKRFFQGWKQAAGILMIILAVGLIGGFFEYQSIETMATFRIMLPLNLFYASIFFVTS